MARKSKSSKLWKPYEDGNVIFTASSTLVSLANFIYGIVLFSQNTSPWGNVIRDFVVFLLNVGVFGLFLRQNHKLARQLENKPIPVYFVTDKKAEEAQHDFEKLKEATGFTAWDKIEGFSTRSSCLMPYEKNRLPPDMDQWKRYIAEALQGVRNFVFAIQGSKIYHIAIKGPATLAIGLSALEQLSALCIR